MHANYMTLQAAIKGVAAQKAEIAALRREIEETCDEIKRVKESPTYKRVLAHKDQQIAELKSSLQFSLRAAGLTPSRDIPSIDPVGSGVPPVEAFSQAIENGDKKAASEIFAAHKKELFASRK